MNKAELQKLREEYSSNSLNESDILPDPVQQFNLWLTEAIRSEVPEPNALTLATADRSGRPFARVVLLKEVDSGFVFYTNYESDKGRQLAENPQASMCFLWKELERQVRINGRIEKLTDSESDDYFQSRPYQSQIGAWASRQSSVVDSREELENKFAELEGRFEKGNVPKPDFWGGYRLIPDTIEFWQGRPGRLHDRIRFSLNGDNKWSTQRLSP